jgi:hypothetical protein
LAIDQAIDAIDETINPIDEKLSSEVAEKAAGGSLGHINRALFFADERPSIDRMKLGTRLSPEKVRVFRSHFKIKFAWQFILCQIIFTSSLLGQLNR